MPLYHRYIIKSLILPVIVITLTLTGIVWLTQSLRFIDLIVNKGLDVSMFLYLSFLLFPSMLMLILPLALFISVLMVYNRFISDSEMIVFKSSGISRLGLTVPALVVALGVTLLGYLISLYLLPASYREFKDTQTFIRNNYASVLLQEGVFSTPTKGLTVYIESRSGSGELHGILVHDARNPDRPITYMAQSGTLVRTDAGPRFDLVQGHRQEIDKEHGNLSVLKFDSYPMDLSVYTSEEGRDWRTPEERYIHELFFPTDVDKKQWGKYIAEGHNRLTWPLFSLVLTLVAVAALFSGQFNRRGQWKRIVSATIIGVLLVILQLIFKSLTASHTYLAPLMYANLLLAAAMCASIILTSRTIDGFPFLDDLLEALARRKRIKPGAAV